VPDVRGWVNVAPLVNGQPSGTDTLSAGEAVTLKWTKAPGNAASVNFLLITNGTTLVLGSDNDLSDGASAPWTVPQGLDGDLVAYAYNASQSLIRQSQPRHVVS
jgi:hypothetical protein